MNGRVNLIGGEIILLYNPTAMKKMLNIFLVGVFASAWINTGGVSVRYPVLERVLANIDRELPADIAQEIRAHTDASNMCGVHAVVDANKQSLQKNNPSTFSNVSFPISHFVLTPEPNSHMVMSRLTAVPNGFSVAVLLRPPRLTA